MRSAEARYAMLEALEGASGEVRRMYSRFAVPRTYLRPVAAVGAGMVGTWLLRRLFGGARKAAVTAAPAAGAGAAFSYLLVQVASALLLPWIRSRIRNSDWNGMLQRMSPTQILFRWLGLEK